MSKVIIFPTDTVYGIGTPIFDLKGIEKIYEIKKRDKDKPLACLCANISQIESIAILNEKARWLINKFLPGSLTLVLESKEEVYKRIGYKTIGVRIPNHKLALDILNHNGPMLTTSVNTSGDVPINEYEKIVKEYSKDVDRIYKATTPSSNVSSTVVSCIDGIIKVLREGEIKIEDLNV